MLSTYSETEKADEKSSRHTPNETVCFVLVLYCVLLLLCLYRAHDQAAPPPRHCHPLSQAGHAPGAQPPSRMPAECAHAQARPAAQNSVHLLCLSK